MFSERPFRTLGSSALVLVSAFVSSPAWADNPIVQTLYTADPAPMVHDGVLYVYTTHDEDVTVNNFFTMNDWRVYSTKDVVNWTDHGSPLHYNDFSWAGGSAWAGQVIHRDGKFYFYVPVARKNGGSVLGVAVSDSPIGPFSDPIGAPLVTSPNCGDIDPSVFIDDDGQAYLYWGNPRLCYVKLNEDMISYQGGIVEVAMNTGSFGVRGDSERPTSYEEGPWFYKRDGLYYMIYPGGPLPEHIAYSTSPMPTGPWTYKDVIMPAEGGSFTNHPGIVDFGGKSLFFYHNGALPGGGGFKRSVAVEEFTYQPDGSIPRMKMTTEGASAVASLNPFERVEAETIAWTSGVETEVCSEGGMNVTDIGNGDYIKLKEVEFGAGATSFTARVAAASGSAAIELRLDSVEGTNVGTCAIASTGGADTWATQTCELEGAQGKHDLYLVFTGGGFKFNWWQVSGPGEPSDDTSGSDAGVTSGDSSDDINSTSDTSSNSGESTTHGGSSGANSSATSAAASSGAQSSSATTAATSNTSMGSSGPANVTSTFAASTVTAGGPDPSTSSETASSSGSNTKASSSGGGCHVGVQRSNFGTLLAAVGMLVLFTRRRQPAK